jgi:hypothetical protein
MAWRDAEVAADIGDDGAVGGRRRTRRDLRRCREADETGTGSSAFGGRLGGTRLALGRRGRRCRAPGWLRAQWWRGRALMRAGIRAMFFGAERGRHRRRQ